MTGPTCLFDHAEQVLGADEVQAKVELTRQAQALARAGRLSLAATTPPVDITAARFPARPVLVDPRELPRRKLTTTEGRVALLHAVAHIEFSAIQLAWDHLYRFRGLPDAYYWDWLSVADEEALHFSLIRERLNELGADYGDLPAHGGLWGIACETAYDTAARMALVPRFMEARGLDVTPGMMDKLAAVGDDASVAVLQRILDDEVGHVALGTQWFEWLCHQRGVDAETEYFLLIERHMKGQSRGPYNLPLRRRAGFSEGELARLSAHN
ncbi:ferritin-like domain-containing protein [Methylococcus sp. EFPC2]|uniref:ferritin-like domain-containing protein n=1 Tax=Methylococcus sp. EFPC2 TaxID=2812648 RepID=UPI0019676655|nr:ferritin-like domain-containing protein [Methylococcus sp. EFPC2]QSA97979.1 ferritin-like domain-containing protein [Methylococcus sp. EFPC2]